MYHRTTTFIVACALALVQLLIPLTSASAQADPATPEDKSSLDFGFPSDVAVEQLAHGDTSETLLVPALMRLERVFFPLGSSTDMRDTAGPELLYVESGRIEVEDGLGLTSTLEESEQVLVQADSAYETRNVASEEASLLRLSVITTTSLSSTPVPAASPAATPARRSVSPIPKLLIETEIQVMPLGPASIFLGRATWNPGTDSGRYTQSGPVALFIESGTLTITGPSGIEGTLGVDNTTVLPADVPLRARNDGNQPAVALMFGVIPTGKSIVSPILPTPTPTVTPSPTPEPTNTPLPTNTPEPSPTPAPTPTSTPEPTPTPAPIAGTVLYEASVTRGLNEWSGSADWKHLNGMLVSDGTEETGSIAAPYQPGSITDYAVEADIQLVACGHGFGLFTRAVDEQAIWARLYCRNPSAGILIGTDPHNGSIAEQPLTPDSEWHTYRVEVRGNMITLFIDGSLLVSATDNRLLSGGSVGLFSTGSQINVRSFNVIALGDESSISIHDQASAIKMTGQRECW